MQRHHGSAGQEVQSVFAAGDGGEWSLASDSAMADVRVHGAVAVDTARGGRVALAGSRESSADQRRPGGSMRRPDPNGRLTAFRPAVAPPSTPEPVATAVDLPEVSRPAGGFPLATVATAGVTAAVASLFFSPIFAVLAGVSALAMVGRWLGALHNHRRTVRLRSEASSDVLTAWGADVEAWASAECLARAERLLDPTGLEALQSSETSPWWERLNGDESLAMTLGLGTIEVDVPTADAKGLEQLVPDHDRRVRLDAVPIEATLEPGLAVCGDRAEVVAAARWLVASALARVGPADMAAVLVTTSDRTNDWDQLKWSPSLAACVAVDVDPGEALSLALDIARRGGASERRPLLVVVDGAEPTGSGLLARILSGREDGVMLLWLGSSHDVPAGCRASVTVAADGSGRLRRLDGSGTTDLRWFGLELAEWGEVMRWTAKFDDPECVAAGQGLVPSVALADVVVAASASGDESARFAAALERRWGAATTQHLAAPIGLDAEGKVEVDLVADGPHMLAAGTTGAGKSELLRTLVVGLASEQPPDLVSFVLIDFKGGGAFDLVAPLPHVAAVVTDLEPAEASRALRGLRAEILDREHRLRDMEISDVGDIDRTHPRAFGRMVVIVDEFAALADELPDFLDGLVDIARRGRSLGVHLVLATQRPSGVVTGQIRANTNLRLCLRVQDRIDSIDVIDDPAAGLLPPIPGRAVLRTGGSRCRQLQVAQVSGQRDRASGELFRLHPSVAASTSEVSVVQAVNASLGCLGRQDDEAVSLVEQIVAASVDVARADPPWTSVPTGVAFAGDGTLALDGGGIIEAPRENGAVVGVLDDPDRRVISPLAWDPTSDGLLVVGADERQIGTSAATAVAAALDRNPSLPAFILDGERSGSDELAALGRLASVVDTIGADEPERLLRAVEQLERALEPRLVVVHNWTCVVDALVEVAGPLGAERLTKLVRRAGTPQAAIVVTARSDRDVPQRALGSLGRRVVHRLADPAGLLSFGLRPADYGGIEGGRCVDPSSGLVGVVATLSATAITSLSAKIQGEATGTWPSPVRVLGDKVDRAALPMCELLDDGWRIPVGLDEDMVPHWIVAAPRRPVVVLGHPGGGRTTALGTISAALDERACVIDDADALEDGELRDRIAAAERDHTVVVVGCTPVHAKRFGSAVADLLQRSTVVLLNPSRNEGELVRLALPDLTGEPIGRAVLVDRGRATVVQIAA